MFAICERMLAYVADGDPWCGVAKKRTPETEVMNSGYNSDSFFASMTAYIGLSTVMRMCVQWPCKLDASHLFHDNPALRDELSPVCSKHVPTHLSRLSLTSGCFLSDRIFSSSSRA